MQLGGYFLKDDLDDTEISFEFMVLQSYLFNMTLDNTTTSI